MISRKFQSLFVAQDQNRCECDLVLEKGVQGITQYLFFHHVQEKAKRLGNPVDDTQDSVEADKSCRSKHYHQFARLIDAR